MLRPVHLCAWIQLSEKSCAKPLNIKMIQFFHGVELWGKSPYVGEGEGINFWVGGSNTRVHSRVLFVCVATFIWRVEWFCKAEEGQFIYFHACFNTNTSIQRCVFLHQTILWFILGPHLFFEIVVTVMVLDVTWFHEMYPSIELIIG